jgi:hypothetical protein
MYATTQSFPEPCRESVRPRSRAALWVGIAVLVAAGILVSVFKLPDAKERLARIPERGPGFASTAVPLTPAEREAYAGATLIHRHYVMAGREFFVTVIDGTHDRHTVHDPRYCFLGNGWRIASERELALPGGTANWMSARLGDRAADAVYWFSDGRRRYSSVVRYWIDTAVRRMTFGRSGPEPVLIFVQSATVPPDRWPALVPEVVRALKL